MWRMLILMVIGSQIMLSGCTSRDMKDYAAYQPELKPEEYFNGPIKAWGVVENWRGKVISRFDVDMQGEWKGDVGTLHEQFTYYDGKTEQRVWTIRKLGEQRYEGEAGDVLGKATGAQAGNALYWAYSMDLEVDGSTYRVKFDDRMWLMHDGVLINRSYIRKFGITVAQLTIFMQKQDGGSKK
jgi:hypothetical protein